MKRELMHLIAWGAAFCGLLLCFGCHSSKEETVEDPTTTYSIIKADSNSGITIVSETGNNPMKVREFIDNYPIPESSYRDKQRKLYAMLDQLKQYATSQDAAVYDEVDSLNYMAIHYLKNLLSDKQSLQYPIRHSLLKTSTSTDKKLKVYAWNENIGFETHSFINVYQYRWSNGNLKSFFNKEIDSDDELNISTGSIEELILLPTVDNDGARYLQLTSGMQGSNCYKGVALLKVSEDSLFFDQPMLHEEENAHNSMVFHYPQNTILEINYLAKKQQLSIRKNIHTEEGDSTQTLRYTFNGTCFQPTED